MLLILFINLVFAPYSNLIVSSKRESLIELSPELSYNDLKPRKILEYLDNDNYFEESIKLIKTSGESYEIPIPDAINTVHSFSVKGETTLFINDQRGGDKIDTTLRDYSFLWNNNYIEEDNIRVIILPGSKILRDTYELKSLSEEIFFQIKDQLLQFKGRILSRFNNFPFVTVDLPYTEIFNLAEQDNIAHIFLDKRVYVCLNESVPIIKPQASWQQLENQFGLELNGTNIKIAVLDTGIDKNHKDLDDLDDNPITTDPKVIAEECFTDEDYTWDGYGHGTHCASIAAGTGEASNYTYVGVAPGAQILNGKVLTDSGDGYDSWIISGIEWAVTQSADIISMSFGKDINGDGTDPVSIAIDWANDQGVICINSAGNEGGGGMFSVGMPAVAKKVITVGSTTKSDYVSNFSSQGPTSDYRIKPDVCAPGSDIIAARAIGTNMGSPIEGNYTRASGTSMAAPHVAGTVALILQAHPDWDPLMVKSALMGNTKILEKEHLWKQGAGRIDANKAINTSLLIIEPSSSFGFIDSAEIITKELTIMNLANSPTTIDLSTNTLCDGNVTNYVSLNVTTLTIPSNTNSNFTLEIGPLDENAPEGWYEGWINITGSQNEKTAPYLFISMSTISVDIYDTDDITQIESLIALVSQPNMSFIDTQFSNINSKAEFLVTSGEYSLCAQMGSIKKIFSGEQDYSRMFMLEKNVSIPKHSNLSISLSLADAQTHSIPTTDSLGDSLIVHAYTQYFCGGPQTWYESYFEESEWQLGSRWSGIDQELSSLTFYSSNYTQPEKICEALGFYATDQSYSEVYLVPLKYWNVSSLPDILGCPESLYAKYDVIYDMPETYPENGLNCMNAFWFTWDHLGGSQGWARDTHKVPAGMNATYYLAPGNATYWGDYMPTYKGWEIYDWGPLEEWNIGNHYPYPQIPLNESETGNMTLGRFSFGPYHPGLNVSVLDSGSDFVLNLSGDIWEELTWSHLYWYLISPQEGPGSYYPQIYANYSLFVNGILYDQGQLNGEQGYNNEQFVHLPPDYLDVDWCVINDSWTINGGNVQLQLNLTSIATLYSNTIYDMTFSLGSVDSTPPMLNGIFCPTNFTPGEDFFINFTAIDTGLGIESHSLKYSFDNGGMWQDAFYQNPYYRVPCVEADALSILINITDLAGNSIQFFSNPVAVCNVVDLKSPSEIIAYTRQPIIISGALNSPDGYGLPSMTVFLYGDKKVNAVTDDNGIFNFQAFSIDTPGIYVYDLISVAAGFYDQQEITITINITEDLEAPSWLEIPTDQYTEYGENFIYNLDATDPTGISHWWINDRINFSIDNDGVISNNFMLPIGVYGIEVWVNDSNNNIQNAIFNIIVQDTTPPEWNPFPVDYGINIGKELIYDLDATDLSGIDHWWINDTTQFSIDENGTITNATTLNVGDYWLEVRAYDPYDNYCTYLIKIMVETTPTPPWISGFDLIYLFGGIFMVTIIFIIKKKLLKFLN